MVLPTMCRSRSRRSRLTRASRLGPPATNTLPPGNTADAGRARALASDPAAAHVFGAIAPAGPTVRPGQVLRLCGGQRALGTAPRVERQIHRAFEKRGRRRLNPEPLGGPPHDGWLTERVRRRNEQEEPGLLRQRPQPATKALFNPL
jgi:hypothetical protein